jgi:hypothetical protein
VNSVLGNIYKVAFWTIAHIAYDPKLLADLRSEIIPALKNGKLDELYLAEKCPKLESLISEILRLTVASALVREIVAPTTVANKQLLPGSKLLVSSPLLFDQFRATDKSPGSLPPTSHEPRRVGCRSLTHGSLPLR